jgi:GxxExxY protein
VKQLLRVFAPLRYITSSWRQHQSFVTEETFMSQITKSIEPSNENELSREIIRCAIEVHRTLGGPGLLECVYEEALAWELQQSHLRVERQVVCPIRYKGHELGEPLRLDILVDGCVIVECKATSQYNPIFESQVLTYLRLTNRRLGLVLNFGQTMLRDGIHRVVNKL